MFMNIIYKYSNRDLNCSNLSSRNEYVTFSPTRKIDRMFREEISGPFVVKINEIVKVNNLYLYSHFLIKKAEYETRGSMYIRELYHDTAESNVDSILKTNLDWQRIYRGKYGYGVSFSPSPEYASKWSTRSNGYSRAMIVADVLIGKSTAVGSSVILPPDDCDTTTDIELEVCVKFYDN